MIEPIPACIPIGNEYMATIRVGADETILESCGVRLRFVSSSAALKAARLEIEARRAAVKALAPVVQKESDIVAEWKKERLRERDKLRSAATLMGIEVVRKRRKVKR